MAGKERSACGGQPLRAEPGDLGSGLGPRRQALHLGGWSSSGKHFHAHRPAPCEMQLSPQFQVRREEAPTGPAWT